jgi:uncharacterized membrane protein YedE/YeeE
MSVVATSSPDKSVVLTGLLGLLALSLFLQHEFTIKQSLLFLTGIGFGVTLYHAAFGFAGAWRNLIRKRNSAGTRAHIFLLAFTSLLFFPLVANVIPDVKAVASVGQVGTAVLIGSFLFGVGMQLGGGCGSGTLFTVGGGNVKMLVTLAFFIVGATWASANLHWWLALPNVGKISLIESFGWVPALLLQFLVLAMLYFIVRAIEIKRHGHLKPIFVSDTSNTFVNRLLFGPWPLWWGIVGLVLLNLITMLIAGHAWSITFAFGLWGAKIWTALGGDATTWVYWGGGYPAVALSRSVLADTTSLMDFGLILGAIIAAAFAGRFAPDKTPRRNEVIAAVIGGLLLGYGARLAFGCNIGALLAGISTGSLHGWQWLIAAFIGNMVGVRLRTMIGMDVPVRGSS